MSESKRGPASALQNVFHAVKGGQTEELVEQFTAEMTLVTEGLVEDQTGLRRDFDALRREQDRLDQRINAFRESADSGLHAAVQEADERLDALDKRIDTLNDLGRRVDTLNDLGKRVDSLDKRLDAIEKSLRRENEKKPAKGLKGLADKGVMSQAILLASIICGTLIVLAVLRLFS